MLRLVPDLLVEGLELLLDPLVPLPLADDDNSEHINFIKYKKKSNIICASIYCVKLKYRKE